MRKIITFKKEIVFETSVAEISSISLEHTLNLVEDNVISGEFFISGEYKISDSSMERSSYEYKLPFDIALDSRYDINNSTVDIDNFYYEVLDNNKLLVNIDVYIDGLELPEIVEKEEILPISDETLDDELNDEILDNEDASEEVLEEERCVEEEVMPVSEDKETNMEKIIDEVKENLFDNMDSNETFATYHVCIVKDGDTLEAILSKYGVTREDLEEYNNLSDIKPGDKLIIPNNKNER